MEISINEKRLLNTFSISSNIGSNCRGGLKRLSLEKEDKEMRDTLWGWMEESGLSVRIDDFGNMYGRREGMIKEAPAIACGSHLDTQPTGGRYDGILGVLSALEIVRTLNDYKIDTYRPIEIINFTNEEGARFYPPMVGSGGVTKNFKKEFVYNLLDDNGVSYKEALKDIGYLGKKSNRFKNVGYFIELHIEQGPVLDKLQKDIGIVQGVYGLQCLEIEVKGTHNHAGSTPMFDRQDSIIATAEMITEANNISKQFKGLRTTVGFIKNYPNITNVIPNFTIFKLDIRHHDDIILKKAIKLYIKEINSIAEKHRVKIEYSKKWSSPAAYFHKEIIKTIEKTSKENNYKVHHLYSGPGHDAKYINDVTKTGMIFVKSVKGISHNEKEYTPNSDIIKGANTLLHTILELSKRS